MSTTIMVAPNGARKTHKDHPALPVSIEETVNEAVACHAAGATILHAHVRDENGKHILDPGLYSELIAEMKHRAPNMLVQTTSEAVGIYTPEEQADCVKKVSPDMASVALKEMTANFTNLDYAHDFYHWAVEAGVHIQHILYSADELQQFQQLRNDGIVPHQQCCVLFVLGRYAADFQSSPDDLQPFLESDLDDLIWFTCAFGQQEQACVLAGIEQGGHARIGFENNLHLADGGLAPSTAALVESLVKTLKKRKQTLATYQDTRRVLGI